MKYHFTPAFFAARSSDTMSIWPVPSATSAVTSGQGAFGPVGVPFFMSFR